MQCAIHQTMLQSLAIYGELYKAKALESSKKRRRRMSTGGDWICKSCNHLNFYWRQSCRNCEEARPQDTSVTYAAGPRVLRFRPGDWYCDVGICGAHNFARRRFCFKCGSLKSTPSFGGTLGLGLGGYYYKPLMSPNIKISQRGWKPGDWLCGRPDCNAHNYAARVICFKCKSSRELLINVSN